MAQVGGFLWYNFRVCKKEIQLTVDTLQFSQKCKQEEGKGGGYHQLSELSLSQLCMIVFWSSGLSISKSFPGPWEAYTLLVQFNIVVLFLERPPKLHSKSGLPRNCFPRGEYCYRYTGAWGSEILVRNEGWSSIVRYFKTSISVSASHSYMYKCVQIPRKPPWTWAFLRGSCTKHVKWTAGIGPTERSGRHHPMIQLHTLNNQNHSLSTV